MKRILLAIAFVYMCSCDTSTKPKDILPGNSELPSVSFAWSAYDGNDYEVYKWDGKAIEQITDNQSDEKYAQYSAISGDIVWLNTPRLIVVDSSGHIDTLSDNYVNARISEELIAWADNYPPQVFVRFNGETQQISDAGNGISNIELCGSIVAWVSSSTSSDAQIMLWENGSLSQISETGTNNKSVSVNAGFVAWLSKEDTDYDVYARSGTTVKALSVNDGNTESAPVCAGNSIAWVETDSSGVNTLLISDFTDTKTVYSSDSAILLDDNGSNFVVWQEQVGTRLRVLAFCNNLVTVLDTSVSHLYGNGDRLLWGKVRQGVHCIRYFDGNQIVDVAQIETTEDVAFYGIRFDSGSYGLFDDHIMWYVEQFDGTLKVYLYDFESTYTLGAGTIKKADT